MKAEIDLDEIIQEHLGNGFNPLQKQAIRFVMRRGIEQALEIASEEAEIIEDDYVEVDEDGEEWLKTKYVLNKDSILSIKKRVI